MSRLLRPCGKTLLLAAWLVIAPLGGCSSAGARATASAASSSATSGSGGSGSGGAGGAAPTMQLCLMPPVAAAVPGTDACPAPMPTMPDAFDDALKAGGIDRCQIRFTDADMELTGASKAVLFDKRRLPDFTALHHGPLRLPGYARETKLWLDDAVASTTPVSSTLLALAVRRGRPAGKAACADLSAFEPAAADPTPLATAVLLLAAHQGKPGDEAAVRAAAAGVPLALQAALARVLGAIDFAATETKAALGTTKAADLRYLAHAHALYLPSFTAWSLTADSLAKLDAVDVDRMADAAAIVARVIENADFASLPDAKFPAFEVSTPLGSVVVHDSSKDTYLKGQPAETAVLLFDLGGDDEYQVPAGASDEKHPIAIAIDVRGADHYGYKAVADTEDTGLLPSDGKGRYHPTLTPDMDDGPITLSRVGRQGAGLAGIGMLFDLGKEGDTYQSLAASQGFGSVGIGVLYDAGGDDTYEAEVGAQGMALFGIGVLIDRSGKDSYQSFAYSQGFGGSKGVGALIDGAGDDTYFVDPGDPMHGGHPLYFSPQLPGIGNESMSQGTASGRRQIDANDQAYMAGGLGLLRDLKGNDSYTGGVFVQGSGYWQGIGMLLEGGGDDTYDALWYIQGSTAHFALAMFLEEGGNDKYNLNLKPAATSIGVGHDFSASIHLDEGGDDHYRAPGLSLGSGNINGIGCLVNVGGNDIYDAAGDPTLGAGNNSAELPYGQPRQAAPTIGIFVDVGGKDTYTVAGMSRALDDTTWSYDPQPYPMGQMVTTEHGCGADVGNGSVSLP